LVSADWDRNWQLGARPWLTKGNEPVSHN
jgi:hypothetical protein